MQGRRKEEGRGTKEASLSEPVYRGLKVNHRKLGLCFFGNRKGNRRAGTGCPKLSQFVPPIRNTLRHVEGIACRSEGRRKHVE